MKKNLLQRFVTSVLFLAVCSFTWAYADFEVNGIYYGISSDGSGVYVAKSQDYSGSIVIPSIVWDPNSGQKYTVTGIGYEAFEGCTNLKSVSIPNTVTYISSFAFHSCSGLTSINIPGSMKYIHDYAFSGCSCLTSISIPNSVIKIGIYAFASCSSLTSVTIPNSVTSIEKNAFGWCTGLTSVTIPNSVTSIDEYAFAACSSLTSLTIPNSVTSIGERAFVSCTGLKSITIGNSVTSIGMRAFCDCSSLTSLTIPNSVTNIGYYAFKGCTGLTSVYIGSGVTYIGDDAFLDCTNITKAEFASIESLCKINFAWYTSNPIYYIHSLYINGREVTDLIIPNSVTSIGSYVFVDCYSLKSITIPNSVTSIGERAFVNCTGLTSINIPNSVISIGYEAFSGCSGLTKAEFGSIESMCKIEYVNGQSNPLCYAHNLYINGQKAPKNLSIPESVTSIGIYAFYCCTDIKSVIIPNSVTSIKAYAFNSCSNLTSVTISENVETIGYRSFSGCSIKEVYCLTGQVPDITYAEAFDYTSGTLYVPASLTDAYKSTDPWNRYFNTILPIDKHYSQTPVQSVSELVNAQVYTAETKRAAWYIPAGSTQMETTEYPTFVYKNSTSSNQQFAFIQHNDKYYIYCVGEGKILNGRTSNTPNRGVLVTEDCQPVTITETGDTDYPLFFSYGTSFNINVGGDNQITIDGWSTFDDGNKVALRPVQGVMLDDSEIIRIIGYIDGENIIDEHYSQTPVQSVEELVNNRQVYTAETKRAAWYIPAGSTQMETTEYPTFVYKNSTSSNQQFAFIQHNDKYYIYCVGEGKILNGRTSNTPNRGVLVTEDCQPVTITETGDTDYPLFFSYGTSFNINVGGDYQITIDYWSTHDDGNKVALRPVQGVTLADKDLRRIIGYIDGCIVGDSNGNNEVEIGDVTSVLTLMATPEATGYNNKAADANGNGEIEIGDVTTILTIMAKGE